MWSPSCSVSVVFMDFQPCGFSRLDGWQKITYATQTQNEGQASAIPASDLGNAACRWELLEATAKKPDLSWAAAVSFIVSTASQMLSRWRPNSCGTKMKWEIVLMRAHTRLPCCFLLLFFFYRIYRSVHQFAQHHCVFLTSKLERMLYFSASIVPPITSHDGCYCARKWQT